MKHLVFVMDKGFYSRQNIDVMYAYGYGFIIATLTPSLAKNAIDEVRPSIRHPKNIILTDNGGAVYAQTSKNDPASDFILFCRLIHHACLICGFSPQARDFASGSLQTLPRSNALALG